MVPFVDDLVDNASIGMLDRETQPQQLQTHPRDFVDQARNVHEPPAAKNVQVTEFARQHAEFMLVFPRKNCAEKFVLWIRSAKILERIEIAPRQPIPCQLQVGIHSSPNSRHHRKRQVELEAMGQNSALYQLRASARVRVIEMGRERNHYE